MKLIYLEGEVEKSFDVDFKIGSYAVREELLKIEIERFNEASTLDKQFKELNEIAKIEDPTDRIAAYTEDMQRKAIERNNLASELRFRTTLKIFKAIINPKQLKTEHKEFVGSSVESEFWRMQDLVGIEERVQIFRATNGLG
jgi:hypothetical protein